MRILLDECVHTGVRAAFGGHVVRTVVEAGWQGTRDETLLAFAEQKFDVFVTIDRKLENQHDLSKLKLGVILVRVPNNKLSSYEPLFAELNTAAENVRPGGIIHIGGARR